MHFSTPVVVAALVALVQGQLLNIPDVIVAGITPGPTPAVVSAGINVGVLGTSVCAPQNGLLTVEVLVDLPPLLSVCLCLDVLATLVCPFIYLDNNMY